MTGTVPVEATAKESLLSARDRCIDQLAGGRVGWVQRMREQGAVRFRERGFPQSTDEDWKYTSVRPIERRAFDCAVSTSSALGSGELASFSISGLRSHRLVFVNGYLARDLSQLDGVASGVVVGSLADALDRDPDAVEPYLGRITPSDAHGFTALNSAFLADGAYVRLGAAARVELPIELVFVATSGDREVAVQPRNLIVAGPDSRATIIERYVALDSSRYLTNALTEVVLERGATLEHCKLQEERSAAFHIAGLFARQAAASRFIAHSVSLGGALVRNDVVDVLDAEGAECTLNGLYLAGGRQHVDNHTQIEHAQPRATSREYYKGVLDDRARAVFHGRIIVRPDAQQSDAQQHNNNLLLSRDAEVDTKPQLEIYADDVKCTHGATVGQLDADAVFYLRSRGVGKREARSLLTYAFAHDVIGRIGEPALRQRLEAVLSDQLLTASAPRESGP